MSDSSLPSASDGATKIPVYRKDEFKTWKKKMIALFDYLNLLEVVLNPISMVDITKRSRISGMFNLELADVSLGLTQSDSTEDGDKKGVDEDKVVKKPVERTKEDKEKLALKEKLLHKSKKAYLIILNAIPSEIVLNLNVPGGDANAAWTKIINDHEKISTKKNTKLREELHKMKMKKKESVTKFAGRIEGVWVMLLERGEEVLEKDVCAILMKGLRKSYKATKKALVVKYKDSELTDFKELVSILEDLEDSEDEEDSSSSESDDDEKKVKAHHTNETTGYRGRGRGGRDRGGRGRGGGGFYRGGRGGRGRGNFNNYNNFNNGYRGNFNGRGGVWRGGQNSLQGIHMKFGVLLYGK